MCFQKALIWFWASVLTLGVGIGTAFAADAGTPNRTVEAHAIASSRDPQVRIGLPDTARYVGTDKWVLFGIADCQLFAFVHADASKNVRQLYWVQFEGYIPSMPKLQHKYTSTRHATLGGLDFYVDTWLQTNDVSGPKASDLKPLEAAIRAKGYDVPPGINTGSDEQHIDALIRAKGYTLPLNAMSVRLVHLLDKQQRKELMVIYSEDLAPMRLTVADLQKGGKEHHQWETIEKGLIQRAEANVTIEPIR